MRNSKLLKIIEQRDRLRENINRNRLGVQEDKLIPFNYDEKNYFLALRENILVFDDRTELLYTLSYDEIYDSSLPLFQKISEIVETVRLNNTASTVKLYVKRNGMYESMTFTNRLDALLIYRRFKRIAFRASEGIDELYIEKNGVIIESYNSAQGRADLSAGVKNILKNTPYSRENIKSAENLDLVSTLTNVEDKIDDIICNKLRDATARINPQNIDKCIELLEKAKKQL